MKRFISLIFEARFAGLVHLVNALFPIIIAPMLIDSFGTKYYSDYIISLTIGSFLYAVIDFGVSSIGVAEVKNGNIGYIRSTDAYRVIALGIINLGFIIDYLYFNFFFTRFDFILVANSYLIRSLFNFYMFQAYEKISIYSKVITYGRLLELLLIIVVLYTININNEEIIGYLNLISSFIVLFILRFNLKYCSYGIFNKKLSKFSFSYLRQSVAMIYNSFAIQGYSVLPVIVAAKFLDSEAIIAYYAIDKIVALIAGIAIPLNQIIYPKLFRKNAHAEYWTTINAISLGFFLFTIAFFYSGIPSGYLKLELPLIVCFILGGRVLISPNLNFLSNVLFLRRDFKYYTFIITVTLILSIVLIYPVIIFTQNLTYWVISSIILGIIQMAMLLKRVRLTEQ